MSTNSHVVKTSFPTQTCVTALTHDSTSQSEHGQDFLSADALKMSAQHELADFPSDVISSLQFSRDGNWLLVGSWDSCVYLYQRSPDGTHPYKLQDTLTCGAPVLDVCWGRDESEFFTVGLDQCVFHKKLDDKKGLILSTHDAASNKVVFSKEHGIVLSTSWDGIMHVHDPESRRLIRVRLAAKPFAIAVSAGRAVVAMAERKVAVYDLNALKQLIEQTGGTSDSESILEVKPWQDRESSLKFMTRAISCMPDGTGFATSSIEGRVGVEWFDEAAQQKVYAFKCHRQSSSTVDEDG